MAITTAVNWITNQIESVFPFQRIKDIDTLFSSSTPYIKWVNKDYTDFDDSIELSVLGLTGSVNPFHDNKIRFIITFSFLNTKDIPKENFWAETCSFPNLARLANLENDTRRRRNFFLNYSNSDNPELGDIVMDEGYYNFRKYLKNAEHLIPLVRVQVKGCDILRNPSFSWRGRYNLTADYSFEDTENLKAFKVDAMKGEVTGWNILTGETRSFTLEDYRNNSSSIGEYFESQIEEPLSLSPRRIVELTENRFINQISNSLSNLMLTSLKEQSKV